jgi:hypothetical protein
VKTREQIRDRKFLDQLMGKIRPRDGPALTDHFQIDQNPTICANNKNDQATETIPEGGGI